MPSEGPTTASTTRRRALAPAVVFLMVLALTASPRSLYAQRGHAGGGHGIHVPHGRGGHGGSSPEETLIGLGVVGVVLGAMLAYGRHLDRKPRPRIRILRTPSGEAPEEIRRAWVGLEIPLTTGETRAHNHLTVEVLTRKPVKRERSCLVRGRDAVALLAQTDADAAAWWQANAPHVLRSNYSLAFPAEDCELLPPLPAP